MAAFEAYLMVEFDCKTGLPIGIDCYSEHEDEITMIGNEYVRIASVKLRVQSPDAAFGGCGAVYDMLLDQLHRGTYDACKITYKDQVWTVEELRRSKNRSKVSFN
jgi:hypothetical protein